jgi:hypothetical protein
MTTTQTKLLETLKFTPRLVGLKVNSDGSKNYLWRVSLKRGAELVRIEFHCGTAHVKDGVPTPPKLQDVIYSLIMDWQGGRETFKDFCACFGYDEDSRKAYKIWEACKKSGEKLQKLFSADEIEELEEAFRDY